MDVNDIQTTNNTTGQSTSANSDGVVEVQPKPQLKRRGKGKPKAQNSELFNSLLSQSMNLSVTEKIRLCRMISGTVGFVVAKPAITFSNAQKAPKKRKEVEKVIPNPFRHSEAFANLTKAKAAIAARRKELDLPKTGKLEPTDPVFIEYKAALDAYHLLRESGNDKKRLPEHRSERNQAVQHDQSMQVDRVESSSKKQSFIHRSINKLTGNKSE